MSTNAGILYIVATPIGNLKDITLRAIETLKEVNYVLCEDTRVCAKLLNNYQISTNMVSFNEFSEDKKQSAVISDLSRGKSIALVSDAGTPLISDPGYKLVREAVALGIKVESIPGPSSVISSLVISGLPPDKFTFIGYLPKSVGKKEKLLKSIKDGKGNLKSTTVLFESPFRLLKTLTSMQRVFGDIEIVVCRELTKMHEEINRGKISQLIERFDSNGVKGEITILLG